MLSDKLERLGQAHPVQVMDEHGIGAFWQLFFQLLDPFRGLL
jgi:hypothetical protein